MPGEVVVELDHVKPGADMVGLAVVGVDEDVVIAGPAVPRQNHVVDDVLERPGWAVRLPDAVCATVRGGLWLLLRWSVAQPRARGRLLVAVGGRTERRRSDVEGGG